MNLNKNTKIEICLKRENPTKIKNKLYKNKIKKINVQEIEEKEKEGKC